MTSLTQIQTAGLARRFGELERRLRDDIRATLLQSGDQKYLDLAGMVHDLGDEAVANELIELDDALIERHIHELRELEAARRRLADSSINRCIECDDDIGYARLLAYPVAVRCVVCQGQHEKTYAHEAMPRM
jgi:RNA polymerase-binding transcription factor DksA